MPNKLSFKKHFYNPPPLHLFLKPKNHEDAALKRCVLHSDTRSLHNQAHVAVYNWLRKVCLHHSGMSTPSYQDICNFTLLHILTVFAPSQPDYSIPSHPMTLYSYVPLYLPYSARVWDLSKPPLTLDEAVSHPDCAQLRLAMDAELLSMRELGIFQPCDLPAGRKPISL